MPDLPPGASSRDLSPQDVNELYLRGGVNRPITSATKTDGEGANWFGPLDPLAPMAPPDVEGRQFDLPVGYNLAYQPRSYESVSFAAMRELAEAYDVLRLVIETRKDQMERQTWSIVPQTYANGDPKTSPDDPVIDTITDFLEEPDGRTEFGTWLRVLLEEMFVTDAAAVYPHRTKGGKLLALELIDGTTMKRVIDDWGRTPEAPAPAFQQVLRGMPAIDYTEDDLIYLPRNPRVNRVYGYSAVEQIITTINIGLRKQLFTLEYYTSGNIPEAIVSVPAEWTPDQLDRLQKTFDTILAGNLAARRKIRFVPATTGQQFHQFKDPDLANKLDEWIARVVCYAFSVPPTPFVTQVNRATAQTAHDAALEEGLAPVMNWAARFINRVIRKYWPGAKVAFRWNDDREVDPQVQETVATGYVTKGLKTINEARDELGLSPVTGGDELRVLTGTGYVKVGANDAAADAMAANGGVLPSDAPKEQTPIEGGGDGKGGPQPKEGEEAQAAKSAGPFRGRTARKGYWGTPGRPAARHGRDP